MLHPTSGGNRASPEGGPQGPTTAAGTSLSPDAAGSTASVVAGVPTASAAVPGSGPPSASLAEALLVEVQGENGAYYKAHVRDVFPESSEVLLCFERDWQPQSRFPLNRVRLPPQSSAPGQPHHFTEGQEIEVYSRASDQVSEKFVVDHWRSLMTPAGF